MVVGLHDIDNTISGSVSQQTLAVSEISRSMAEVAISTADISGDIEPVSTTAQETGQQAQGALSEV